MSQTVGAVQSFALVPPAKPNAGKTSYRDALLSEMLASSGKQILSLVADFNVTSSTALVLVTGLSGALVAGKKYNFKTILFTNSDVSAGVKVSLEGTATYSALIAEALCIDAGVVTQNRVTALSTNAVAITAITNGYITIEGSIVCTANGTFKIHFAQNVSNAVASKILANSSLEIQQIS